jgi:hypothetical protein
VKSRLAGGNGRSCGEGIEQTAIAYTKAHRCSMYQPRALYAALLDCRARLAHPGQILLDFHLVGLDFQRLPMVRDDLVELARLPLKTVCAVVGPRRMGRSADHRQGKPSSNPSSQSFGQE